MKKINRIASGARITKTADGKFGYLKNLSKYYLTCISYLPSDTRKTLQRIKRKPDYLRTSEDEAILAEERYRQEIISMFERVYTNSAKEGDKIFAIDFIKRNSLEELVQSIIPKEFDNVYTVFSSHSSLEVNHLIRNLKGILGNSDKARVISAYLSYCLDDKKIKENMPKDFVKADTSRVKVIR